MAGRWPMISEGCGGFMARLGGQRLAFVRISPIASADFLQNFQGFRVFQLIL